MNHNRSLPFFSCLHNLAVRKSQVLVVVESKSLEGPIFLFFHLSALAFVPGSCRVLGLKAVVLLLCISLKSPLSAGLWIYSLCLFFFLPLPFFLFWLSFTRLSRTHRLLSACCWYCEASGGRRSTTPQEQWIFPIIWLSRPPPPSHHHPPNTTLPESLLPLPHSPPPSLYYPAISPALFRGNLRVLGEGGALF